MSPHAARRAVDGFAMIVAASIGIALAGLTWRLLGDPGVQIEAAPAPPRSQRPVDVEALAAFAPFGTGGAASATQATDQSVVLRGIMLAEPRSASSALISVGGAAPAAFAIGQSVGPDTIAGIEIDHVVFSTGGGQQILAFPDRQGAAGATASATGPATSSAPAPAAAPPSPAPPNGPALLGGLGTPAADGLHVGQPNAQMQAAGLQTGDVVTAINGLPAADAVRDPGALAGALSSGVVRFDVARGNRHLTLAVPVR